MKTLCEYVLLLSLLTLCASVHAAAYIKFDGISAESEIVSARLPGSQFDSLSSASGIFSPDYFKAGKRRGAMGAGNLTVVRELDKASPKLMQHLKNGKPIRKLTLSGYQGQGKRTTYFSHSVRNAMVKNIRIVTEEGKNLEEVSFGYEEIKWTLQGAPERRRR